VTELTQAGEPPAGLRTISFGPINVTADYQKVDGQPGQDQDRYLARSYEALGGQRTDAPITGLNPTPEPGWNMPCVCTRATRISSRRALITGAPRSG
jgi:hypothetical protein